MVALTSKSNPFWFESTRKSWQSATQSSVKRLFQGATLLFGALVWFLHFPRISS
jgi:hypothetical protein